MKLPDKALKFSRNGQLCRYEWKGKPQNARCSWTYNLVEIVCGFSLEKTKADFDDRA